jgi:alpha-beta hydrolase superfamily lysophospholipase
MACKFPAHVGANRNFRRGLLQIADGMGEHISRYETLIEELVHGGLVARQGEDYALSDEVRSGVA